MATGLFNRFQATILFLATAGLFVLAVLNFRQESQFQQPDDGVYWRETAGGLEAVKVLHNSPAQRAGIRVGDLLTRVAVQPVATAQPSDLDSSDLLGAVKPLPDTEPVQPGKAASKPAQRGLPERASRMKTARGRLSSSPILSMASTASDRTARQFIQSPATAFPYILRLWLFPNRWTAAVRRVCALSG